MVRARTASRRYLRAGERRTQLLDAAAAVVGRGGLGGLTMAAVAGEAGVSRQWVYERFADVDDLCRALVLDRFAALDARIDAFREHVGALELVELAARQVWALNPADRRILWALVHGSEWNRPELAGVRAELKERILHRWTGVVEDVGYGHLDARAVVWAVVHAVFGLADQIERESLEVESAVVVLRRFVSALTGSPHAEHHRRRRPGRPRTGGSALPAEQWPADRRPTEKRHAH